MKKTFHCFYLNFKYIKRNIRSKLFFRRWHWWGRSNLHSRGGPQFPVVVAASIQNTIISRKFFNIQRSSARWRPARLGHDAARRQRQQQQARQRGRQYRGEEVVHVNGDAQIRSTVEQDRLEYVPGISNRKQRKTGTFEQFGLRETNVCGLRGASSTYDNNGDVALVDFDSATQSIRQPVTGCDGNLEDGQRHFEERKRAWGRHCTLDGPPTYNSAESKIVAAW